MCARALVLVPREPVRALARLAAVPLAVDARHARVPAAATISERTRRVWGGFPAHRTRPLLEQYRLSCMHLFCVHQDTVVGCVGFGDGICIHLGSKFGVIFVVSFPGETLALRETSGEPDEFQSRSDVPHLNLLLPRLGIVWRSLRAK